MRLYNSRPDVRVWTFSHWKFIPKFSDLHMVINNFLEREGVNSKYSEFVYTSSYSRLFTVNVPVILDNDCACLITVDKRYLSVVDCVKVDPALTKLAYDYAAKNYQPLSFDSEAIRLNFLSYVKGKVDKLRRCTTEAVPENLFVYDNIFCYRDEYNKCVLYVTYNDSNDTLIYCVYTSGNNVSYFGLSDLHVRDAYIESLLSTLKDKDVKSESVDLDALLDFSNAVANYIEVHKVIPMYANAAIKDALGDTKGKSVKELTIVLNKMCEGM